MFLLTAVVAAIVAPRDAAAQEEVVIATAVGGGVIVLGGVTTLIGNAVYTGQGVTSPTGWRVTGWMFGSFNLLAGAVPLTLGIVDDNGPLVGIGVGSIALAGAIFGVVGYATSLLDESRAEATPPVVIVHPTAFRASSGDTALGAAVSVLRF